MIEAMLFLLIIGTIIYVGLPLFRSKTAHKLEPLEQIEQQRTRDLLSRKDAVYSTLKDLEFDYKMGKLSHEDYEELKRQYEWEAISLLRKIDELSNSSLLEQQLEAEIRALKRRGDTEKTTYCPQCGRKCATEDKFCSHCGTRLDTKQ